MPFTVSPQIRLVALVGGIAALGLAAFMLTAGRSSPGATAASVGTIKQLHPVHKRTVQPAVAKPKPPKPKPKPAVAVLPGLPSSLAQALRKHDLVVVGLFDPQARVDRITLAEASAAAEVTRAGFLPLSVLDQRQAGPLVRQLGVLSDPAVLVYRRPGKLVARFDSFADRDTVAQAVVNAMPPALAQRALAPASNPAAPPLVTLRAWDDRAGKICTRAEARLQRISPDASQAEFLRWVPPVLAAEQEIVVKLKALPAPSRAPDRLLAQRLIDAIARFRAQEMRLVELVKREGKAGASRLVPVDEAAMLRARSAATAAGATGCAVLGA